MIELKEATKKYGTLTAVDNVSFSISKGESFALLGPNGAGKTTILKMMLGFCYPTWGSIYINGLESSNAECRKGIGYLAENHLVPPYLTGLQFLMRSAELLDISPEHAKKQCLEIVEKIGMKGRENDRAGTYSKGMAQRFGLGAALLGDPWLLLLDEPTSGLDPIGIREIRLLLETLKNKGMTIFLNSHLLSEVEKICDTAAIINRGRLIIKDSISAIARDGETLEDVFVRLVRG